MIARPDTYRGAVLLDLADVDAACRQSWRGDPLWILVALVRQRCGVGEHASAEDAARLSPSLGEILTHLDALGVGGCRCTVQIDLRHPVRLKDDP